MLVHNEEMNETQLDANRHLSNFVSENFRYAQVFEDYGLDFCCNGNRPLKDACAEKGIDIGKVLKSLQNTGESQAGADHNFAEWDMSFLIDYIINVHHSYVKKSMPNVQAHFNKIAEVHGENHPELKKMKDLFADLSDELEAHMEKEEKILFPVIKHLEELQKNGGTLEEMPFESVKDPISMMESEHDTAGEILKEMRELSSGYKVPEDGCSTYEITYKEVDDFEKDLHKHIHLENNILFPKATSVEFELNNY